MERERVTFSRERKKERLSSFPIYSFLRFTRVCYQLDILFTPVARPER